MACVIPHSLKPKHLAFDHKIFSFISKVKSFLEIFCESLMLNIMKEF